MCTRCYEMGRKFSNGNGHYRGSNEKQGREKIRQEVKMETNYLYISKRRQWKVGQRTEEEKEELKYLMYRYKASLMNVFIMCT